MNPGWIQMLSSNGSQPSQLSVMAQGSSGAEMPVLSIEVGDVETVYQKAVAMRCEIIRRLTHEQ